ncbi:MULTISPECIES: endonuclease/exonuclease/phosphatase family protein [unclassified Shewanella]|uniref:endonuclease/exonuclease/phosphatase family protein n=1 Tax=unclassified Shewanella TaxID=196818 RepID=UPI001BC2226F|nr:MULTISPECIES: endonuclease/exonuclease/phosphatase family protein [unclassified Shewanella]GIU10955.1 EEP domain-containing protein [Shewanella sp. MBTL60-112-B1]GIU33104.1 EEP domain-containing protein [Shewanella sp. MBTL60-112-B2]
MAKIIRKLVFLTLIAALAGVAYVYDASVIPTEDVLVTNLGGTSQDVQCISQPAKGNLDRYGKLDVTTWNLYKQKNDGWNETLKQLAERSDLLLLQEAQLTPELKAFIGSQELSMLLAKAFSFADEPVGVMNLTRESATSSCVFRKAEPYINYPKSMLISYYPLSDNSQLLVANIHSINFTFGLEEYQSQLRIVQEAIKGHQGPVIFAGDMNTWSDDRFDTVKQLAKLVGLIEAIPSVDSRTQILGHNLDHIFYRDLELVKAESIITSSSDHNPVKAYFRLIKKRPVDIVNSDN